MDLDFWACFGWENKVFSLPIQTQKSRSILKDRSRFFGFVLDGFKMDLDFWVCFGWENPPQSRIS